MLSFFTSFDKKEASIYKSAEDLIESVARINHGVKKPEIYKIIFMFDDINAFKPLQSSTGMLEVYVKKNSRRSEAAYSLSYF